MRFNSCFSVVFLTELFENLIQANVPPVAMDFTINTGPYSAPDKKH
jgi:hypothetical protein